MNKKKMTARMIKRLSAREACVKATKNLGKVAKVEKKRKKM